MSTSSAYMPSNRGLGARLLGGLAVVAMGGLALFGLFIAGLLPVFLPWFLVAGLCIGVVYLVVLMRWPTAGIAGYLVVLLLSPDFKLSDVVTVVVVSALAARQYFSGKRFVFEPRRLALPYLLLMLLGAASLALAIGMFKNSVPFIYRDGRVLAYWLWLPLLLSMVQTGTLTRSRVQSLVMFFACVVAVVALIQFATGMQFVAEGRVGDIDGTTGFMGGVTRVQLPGYVFVSFCLTWLLLLLTSDGKRVWLIGPCLVVFALALYVNFGRALWAWTLVALLLCLPLLPALRAFRVAAVLVVGGAFLIGGLYAIKPDVIENAVARMTSVKQEGGGSTSYGLRQLENDAAIRRISRSPVFGVGLGGEYRRWFAEFRLFEDHTRYVHNTYLFYAVKLGLPGLAALLWLIAAVWRQAYALRRPGPERESTSFNIALAAYLPAMLGLNITQPELAGPFAVVFVCFAAAALNWGHGDPAASFHTEPRKP